MLDKELALEGRAYGNDGLVAVSGFRKITVSAGISEEINKLTSSKF